LRIFGGLTRSAHEVSRDREGGRVFRALGLGVQAVVFRGLDLGAQAIVFRGLDLGVWAI
jgi:hypothetical protein